MRLITKLAAGFLGLSILSSAMAFEPGHPRHEAMPEPAEAASRMAEHLGLDEATQATIEAILTEGKQHATAELERIRTLHEAVRDMRSSDDQDAKRLRKLVHQIADIRADLELHRMSIHDEIEALLTPEQAEKFRAARARRHHGPPGHGPGPHGDRGDQGPRHLDADL